MQCTTTALAAWLEGLTVTQGRLAGQPFTLAPWERRFVRGLSRAPSAALSVARGNGKSTFTAALAAAAFVGPLAEPRADVVCVASSFQQARIIFEHVLAFLRPAVERTPRRWRIQDSSNRATIEDRETGARVRCIGSDPRRAHGLAPLLVLADEPAQWPASTSDSMRAALETAQGKIPGSRFVALGTRPADTGHWFAKMLRDPGVHAQQHAADPGDPPFTRRTWRKSNPSLDMLPDLEAAIRQEAARARRDPSLLAAFKALRLNLGTSDVERAALLEAGTWLRIETNQGPPAVGPALWGIDLGTSHAMSAVCSYWPETGRLDALAAFPERPSLAERGLRDGVGDLYRQMAARGELVTCGGQAVSVPALLTAALERFGRPAALAADRWREAELRDALDAAGVPRAALVARGQGFRDGAEDVRAFRRACLEGRVRPRVSLLMRAALSEATTISDPAGNAKLAKASEGGRRFRAKDDAAAAAILAVSLGVRSESPRPAHVYRGVA